MTIPRCYDSHIHLAATGEVAVTLDLSQLTKPEDVRHLKVTESHFRGSWLVGFGWDENKWTQKSLPTRQILDEVFPDFPVAFSRADGHAHWVNTQALKISGLVSPETLKPLKDFPENALPLDAAGTPTGVLVDQTYEIIQSCFPPWTSQQVRSFILAGEEKFLKNGFSHVRDMSGDATQWDVLCKLADQNLLSVRLEQLFRVASAEQIQPTIDLILRAKKDKRERLRPLGMKIFLDGALGSEGAYLSRCYGNSVHRGLLLWSQKELFEIMELCFQNQMEVAVHSIGDGAADLLVQTYLQLEAAGIQGKLNIEHAEVIRTETVQRMRGKNITCHMQPCHWLSDQRWLEKKIGPLTAAAFPWRVLNENKVEVFFGSDSPIERPSVPDNFMAIEQSADRGIAKPLYPFESFHSHPDTSWGKDCQSIFKKDELVKFVLDGKDFI